MEQTAKAAVEKATPRFHYGYVVLTMIVLAVFGSLGLARFGYASILPAMQDSLKLTNAQTGELQSWNSVGYLLVVVFAGILASHYGPRVVISISLLIVALAMIASGLFPVFDAERIARFFTGVGGAGANVPAMALISAWFGAKRRGLANGAGVAGSSVGLIVTGPLIPVILNQYGAEGWRVSWYVLGAMGLATFVLCLAFLRNRPSEMGLLPIGESEAESTKRNAEKKASALDWGLVYKSKVLWQLAAIYFAFGFSYIIYSTFFVRYLVKEAGFDANGAGTLWLQVGIVTTLSGFIWGAASDRWGRRIPLIAVFALQGLSFIIFGSSHNLIAVYFSAALFALTAWSIPALMSALAGDIFGARLAPAAFGLMTIIFGIGQIVSPYLAGAIADATGSFAQAFLIAGFFSILGAAGSLALRTLKLN